EDAEDQLLLLQAADIRNLLSLSRRDELLHRHPLELGDVDVAVLRIILRNRRANAAHALGRLIQLFSQREWFFAIELGKEVAIDLYVAVAIGRPHAAMHGRAWATLPRIAVRLISHELFAPGEESGARGWRQKGGTRKRWISEGWLERPARRCLYNPIMSRGAG